MGWLRTSYLGYIIYNAFIYDGYITPTDETIVAEMQTTLRKLTGIRNTSVSGYNCENSALEFDGWP